ncbi:MAG: hypothetical protein E7170_01455 [Firmicutes bacterium]|nr:hypothetical protein [Bacillota bacterium]
MKYDELKDKLKQLRNEDIIWIIYIGIIIMSWYSNTLERKYFIYNDQISKEKYRKIMIFIFSILIVVYLYFLKDSFEDLKKLKCTDLDNKKVLTYLSFLGSLFIFLSGVIFLYIAIKDEEIDIELAFN